MTLRYFFFFLLFLFPCCTWKKWEAPPPKIQDSCAAITYANDINPIIMTHCAYSGCHDPYGSAPGDYTTYSTVKTAVDMLVFQQRVLTLKDMPPTAPLQDSLIRKINCWLNAGAPDN